MKRLVMFGAMLIAACGSDETTGTAEDKSPTTPTGAATSSSSGGGSSSGASSSGGSSSGASSSGGTSSSGGASSGGTDAGTDSGPAGNCVPKGYAGNEKKVGAYCDDTVSCPFSIDPFLVCTKAYDPTGNHWFCTAACSKDSECGSGASCVKDPQGSGCVPTQCQ